VRHAIILMLGWTRMRAGMHLARRSLPPLGKIATDCIQANNKHFPYQHTVMALLPAKKGARHHPLTAATKY
jgi:hypothetical protein